MASRTEIEILTAAGHLLFGGDGKGWRARLADRMGISQMMLSLLLSGQRTIATRHMSALSKALADYKKSLRRTASAIDTLRREIEGKSK
ncbi:transcriptional regulator with XRE-family HTH domain [Rhodopseudomonas rhenobacensis]|uniref:Transcriptional regulator with XRE-family HTH domain n=1 Tax=Rhodopseudomonas rhenobacensis TaxID=87461 RepID=A0A7W7Z2M1_9BRAD|nr:hypothetical protein [Rhodopseudomonas rhenobacensis]MBB5046852.1 transcriptional regulator with XRE-family HTH domain [Rhodopseudomonas rhenobacensis]